MSGVSSGSAASLGNTSLSATAPTTVPHYSVLAVGILTSDVVLDCAYFPSEDESIRALNCHTRPGGNATNTLRVVAQLAASPVSLQRLTVSTSLLASLGSADTTAASVQRLHTYGIDTSHCPCYEQQPLPTSYIVNSQRTGSRTIVHYRGQLPELSAAHFTPLATAHTLYHFEGRSNTVDLHAMLTALTQQQQPLDSSQQPAAPVSPFSRHPLVSLEVEKHRDGIHRLFHLPNLLVLSREYALTLSPDATSPQHFLSGLAVDCPLLPQPVHQLVVVCWGEQGAAVRLSDGRVCVGAAERVEAVVDSVGAGDTFIAALLYGVLALREQLAAWSGRVEDTLLVERLLAFANAVAAAKCRITGIDLPKHAIEQLIIDLYSVP